jgi:tetratricopeptide (TPR) repeat protein
VALLEGDLEAAVNAFTAAIEYFERSARQPRLALRARVGLARALEQRGKIDPAIAEYRKALTSAERLYGPRHPEIARLKFELALTLNSTESTELLQQAVEIWQSAADTSKLDLGDAHLALAKLAHEAGDFEAATRQIDRARAAFAAITSDSPIHAADIAVALAAVHYEKREFTIAAAEFQSGLAIYEAEAEPLSSFEARLNLAQVQTAIGDFEQARVLFEICLAQLDSDTRIRGSHLDRVQHGLATIALIEGRADDAAEALNAIGSPPSEPWLMTEHALLRELLALRHPDARVRKLETPISKDLGDHLSANQHSSLAQLRAVLRVSDSELSRLSPALAGGPPPTH